jgi:hypothetical protein
VPAQKACAWILNEPRNPFECDALCSRSNDQGRRTVVAFPGKQWVVEERSRGRCRQLLAHDLRARRNLRGLIASNERQWFLEAV